MTKHFPQIKWRFNMRFIISMCLLVSTIFAGSNGIYQNQKHQKLSSGNITETGFLVEHDNLQFPLDRMIYRDDSTANLESVISYEWSGSIWVNDYQYSFTYDSNGYIAEAVYQDWSGTVWVIEVKTSLTHDSNGNRTERLIQWWDGTVWVNNYKEIYTYDSNENMTEELAQDWDGTVWLNTWKISCTYDSNGNMTEELTQEWDGTVWLNYYMDFATYDSNGNMIEELWMNWDETDWVSTWNYSYTYDSNGNMTEELYRYWNGAVWVNYTWTIYNFTPLSIENAFLINEFALQQNYPNPFNPVTTIHYELPQRSEVQITIFDLMGREIATLVSETQDAGYKTVQWDASNDPSGMYFYQIRASEFVQIRKMVLLK